MRRSPSVVLAGRHDGGFYQPLAGGWSHAAIALPRAARAGIPPKHWRRGSADGRCRPHGTHRSRRGWPPRRLPVHDGVGNRSGPWRVAITVLRGCGRSLAGRSRGAPHDRLPIAIRGRSQVANGRLGRRFGDGADGRTPEIARTRGDTAAIEPPPRTSVRRLRAPRRQVNADTSIERPVSHGPEARHLRRPSGRARGARSMEASGGEAQESIERRDPATGPRRHGFPSGGRPRSRAGRVSGQRQGGRGPR